MEQLYWVNPFEHQFREGNSLVNYLTNYEVLHEAHRDY